MRSDDRGFFWSQRDDDHHHGVRDQGDEAGVYPPSESCAFARYIAMESPTSSPAATPQTLARGQISAANTPGANCVMPL